MPSHLSLECTAITVLFKEIFAYSSTSPSPGAREGDVLTNIIVG
jgi:hypothetical protein